MLAQSLKAIKGYDYLAVFPSGWEARPWDNIYTVGRVQEEGGLVRLNLSEGWEFIIPAECRYFHLRKNLFVLLRNSRLIFPGGRREFSKGVFCLIEPNLENQQKVFDIYRSINEEMLVP